MREKEKRESRKTSAQQWAKEQERFESTSIKLPDGVERYKLETGTHLVDFLPYRVGKGNPRADEGFIHFEREFTAHKIPVPGGKTNFYCCLWDCFKKKCPVCEWMNTHGNTADEDLVRSLRGSTRHLWVVNDKPGNEKNKLKVFESNHYNRGMGFGEMLADAINSVKNYGDFSELEGGLTLQLTVKEQTWPGGKYNAVTRIDFLPRNFNYSKSILDKAPCLDDCLIEMAYGELKRLIDQGQPSEEDNDKKSTKSQKEEEEDEDEEDEEEVEDQDADDEGEKKNEKPVNSHHKFKVGDYVMHGKHGECEILKVSGDGTSLKLEDEEGEVINAVDPDECKKVKVKDQEEEEDDDVKVEDDNSEDDEEEEEEEEDEDEEDEEALEEDEDEEEEKPQKRTKPSSKKSSPKSIKKRH